MSRVMIPNTVLLLMIYVLQSSATLGKFAPNILKTSNQYFLREGDLNLGAIISIHDSTRDGFCAKSFSYTASHSSPHILQYQLEEINRRDDILPNIRLGLIALDDCHEDTFSVPRMMQLLPLRNDSCPVNSGLSVGQSFDVVGLIGTSSSESTRVLASLAAYFQMPQIGVFARSDDLTDRSRYPTHFNLLPSERYQANAIIDFVKYMDWTTVSVAYLAADFGLNGKSHIYRRALEVGICIEEAYEIKHGFTSQDYTNLIMRMVNGKKATIVIVYDTPSGARKMLTAYHKMWIQNELWKRLTWILTERITWTVVRGRMTSITGSFHISVEDTVVPRFYEYYEDLNPEKAPYDPWFPDLWQQLFDCTYNETDNRANCTDFTSVSQSPNYRKEIIFHRWGDVALVYAHAIDALIRERCPEALFDKSLLKTCVKPWLLSDYIFNVDFERSGERLRFNNDGEWQRQFVFHQGQYSVKKGNFIKETVAVYDSNTEQLTVHKNKMLWWRFNLTKPTSFCSPPCAVGEIRIEGSIPCCWECHRCLDNEIVSLDGTSCIKCPPFTWPVLDANDCYKLQPSQTGVDPNVIVPALSLGFVGLVAAGGIIIVVIKNRTRKVIQGSSTDMLIFILLGTVLCFLTVPTFIFKPTYVWCALNRIGFSLSPTLIFAPLLIKIVHIYRTFKASKNLQTTIAGTNRLCINLQATTVVFIQLAMTIGLAMSFPPAVTLYMPVPTEPYAELKCDWNSNALLLTIGFNAFITFLCIVYGIAARKIPENYNESWYILITSVAAFCIWGAFTSAYLTVSYASHKTISLALAIYLHGIVVALFLFGPKIYALRCVLEKDIQITDLSRGPGGSSSMIT